MRFLTLDDIDAKDKTLLLRVDLNLSVDEKTKKIEPSPRLSEHAKTIVELAGKKAKVVVLAHQGRKGDYDFIPLAQHAKMLEREAGRKIIFADDKEVCGRKTVDAIKKMKPGEIVLLENVRFLDDETKGEPKNARIVRALAPLADYFVLDAFSVSHRAQASVVGFEGRIPCVAGRVMERELKALGEVSEHARRPIVFIFGGAKPEDSLGIMEHWLKGGRMDKALTGGALANFLLMASKVRIGKGSVEFLEKKEAVKHLPKAAEMIQKYSAKIDVPVDAAVDENGKRKEYAVAGVPADATILDIGERTAKRYALAVSEARTIVMNGPMGMYENEEFALGTKIVLEAIANNSTAYSLIGGGHTITAVEKLGIDKDKISYISLSGKALIEFLSGQKLPGVEMLERSANK